MAVGLQDVNVYGENKRIVSSISSQEFGTVVYVSIGATLVGSIILSTHPGQPVKRYVIQLLYHVWGILRSVVTEEVSKATLHSGVQPLSSYLRRAPSNLIKTCSTTAPSP